MATKTKASGKGTIRWNSILGGMSPTTHFSGEGQFRAALGIDPAQPMDDLDSNISTIASGIIRPTASEKFSSTTIQAAPLWIQTNPKNALAYVLDARGSAYSIDAALATVTALSDAGTLGGLGNGMEYLDNYQYFATGTDVTRYGPLNGAAGFVPNYWTSVLGKAALTNTAYPTTFKNKIQIPNHVMHRHSDGAMYIADVSSGNQGQLHYIKTTKTTVEGDTNDGSTATAVLFGFGLWPTSIESYGSDVAVALYEGSSTGLRQKNAKMAFWDTTSPAFNKITWVEFPDPIITATKNVNGVLYVVSGSFQTRGFRVTRFIGGYSFEEVYYSETGEPCLQGAIDGLLNRVVFGSHTNVPEDDGCVYALGLQKGKLSQSGLFNIMRSTGGNSSTSVTALCFADATEMGFSVPIIGWSQAGEGSTGASHGLDKQGTSYSAAPSVIWSPLYRIGQNFKLTKIRLLLPSGVVANQILTAKVYTDSGNGTTFTLQTINFTNYPGKRRVVLRNAANGKPITGDSDFWLELRFTGSVLMPVTVPVLFEYEVYDD